MVIGGLNIFLSGEANHITRKKLPTPSIASSFKQLSQNNWMKNYFLSFKSLYEAIQRTK